MRTRAQTFDHLPAIDLLGLEQVALRRLKELREEETRETARFRAIRAALQLRPESEVAQALAEREGDSV